MLRCPVEVGDFLPAQGSATGKGDHLRLAVQHIGGAEEPFHLKIRPEVAGGIRGLPEVFRSEIKGEGILVRVQA